MEDHTPITEDHQQEELNDQRTRVIIIIAVILFFLLLGILVAYFTSSSKVEDKKPSEAPTVSTIVENLNEPDAPMLASDAGDNHQETMPTETMEKSSSESMMSTDEETMSDSTMKTQPTDEQPEESEKSSEDNLPISSTPTMTDSEPENALPATMVTEKVMVETPAPKQINGKPMIDLKVHEQIVNTLKKRIREQKITIENLEAEIASLKDDIRYRMMQLPKPKAITVGECTTLPVGTWKLTPDCEMELKKAIAKVQNMMEHVIAWEIIPRVDFQAYGGMSPELKQEGLASYRANEVILKLDIILPEKVVKFKGFTLEDENKRGWKIKVYILESGLESY